MKICRNQYFLGHSANCNYLSVFFFQYCSIFSFLVDSVSKFTILTQECMSLHSCSCWFKLRRVGFQVGQVEKGFSNCSFILYFEFCVQNIFQLRNKFQMLNVTNRSWKFGVGRLGGYRETPIKEGTLFFSRIYTLSGFCSILELPIRVSPQYKMGSC